MEQFDQVTYITISSELEQPLAVGGWRLAEEPAEIPWVMQEEGDA